MNTNDNADDVCNDCGSEGGWYLSQSGMERRKCDCGKVLERRNVRAQKSGRVSIGGRR